MTRTAVGAMGAKEDTRRQDRTRVVIAEDSVLLREGIARLLEESGFEVAGQAEDAEDLLRKVGAHKPDVAIIDVRMAPTHTDEGLRAAHRIRAEHPGSALDPEVVGLMVGRRRKDDPLAVLSPRERDVLTLMAEGKSNAGIADGLHVSLAAVEKHVTRIFAKLELGHEPGEHRRVLAVLTLLRAG
jgi:DNA-binding NarL/FixJ family response regulator